MKLLKNLKHWETANLKKRKREDKEDKENVGA